MGISSFSEFISKIFPSKSERALGEFRGNIAIVDGSHRLLKQSIGRISKESKNKIKNAEGRLIVHLYVTFVTIIGMLDYGIQPFFVFEGNTHSDKKNTCTDRRKTKDNAKKRCEEIEDKDSDDYFKQLKKSFYLTNSNYDEVRKLLDLAGIPYVVSHGEADPQCAALSKYYKLPVITDDTDILVYGGSKIWKDFSLSEKKTHEITKNSILDKMLISANIIRTENGLRELTTVTYENFVNYCIMLGTDYSPNSQKTKISGLSSSDIFKFFVLNDFNVAQTCEYITNNTQGKVSLNFVQNCETIRSIYLDTPVIHPESIDVIMRAPKTRELLTFLCDEIGLDRDFVSEKIGTLENNYRLFQNIYNVNSDEQTNFGNFRSYQLKHYSKKLSHMLSQCESQNSFPKQQSTNSSYFFSNNRLEKKSRNEFLKLSFNTCLGFAM